MNYYKATLQYDGTGYAGFQWQASAPTIQAALNQALALALPERFSTRGASRTDTGVHAREQVVRITSSAAVECDTLTKELARLLPPQIRCLNVDPCSGKFNPSADAVSKEYRYLFTNQLKGPLIPQRFIANHARPLNGTAISLCLKLIRGKHDFCNFASMGSNVKSTVREITFCEITEVDVAELFDSTLFSVTPGLTRCYQIRFVAPGFLKQMIRHLVAALWLVGNGKMSEAEFVALLQGPKMSRGRWRPAPAQGLHLYKIDY